MQRGKDSRKYIRLTEEPGQVWGVTLKSGSTSLLRWLPQPRMYTDLRKGDHVRILVRDPRDRLVSAWRWFTGPYNTYVPDILEASPVDHEYILDSNSPFDQWVQTALRHWNAHWAPQTEIHPRWREFELVNLADWGRDGKPHDKQTRQDSTWEQYYSEGLLALVNEVYKEDLEMWKEVENGTDTRANRIL